MDADADNVEASGRPATRCDSVSGTGVLEDARSLWHELLGLSHDRFRLAALETQRAGESLVAMIMTGVIVAVLLSSAWLGLMAAVVAALVEHGADVSSAILLAVAANLLLALILCVAIRHKSRYLKLPATLRSLQPTGRQKAEKS